MTRPLSVQEIVAQAQDFEFSTNRPIQQWIRAGKMLLTEAAICEQDGNLQMAYLYTYRHAQLVLDRLPQHPDYKDPRFRDELAQARKALQRNLQKLELWKPRITQEHECYVNATGRRNAERQRMLQGREEAGRRQSVDSQSRRRSTASDDEMLDGDSQTLRANEHSQLAVDLAHREIRRRDATRQSTREAGISPGTVASRRRGIVVGPADLTETANERSHNEGVWETGKLLHRQDSRQAPRSQRGANRDAAAQAFHYPTVPSKKSTIDWKMPAMQPSYARSPAGPPPTLPVKQKHDSFTPAIPPKPLVSAIPSPPTASLSPLPAHEQQAAPPKYTFKPTAFTESGAPLRTVMLPPDLRTSFLNLAHPNTLRNFETCGILCGTLISNALFINHLIIPDQTSTSDTCDTTEEGDNALFDYCDSHELLVCGWIHTHPTQSCFLSSRDLHTSSGYQVMLPEAIAIVCAPRQKPDWGIFRLTDPPGLGAVLDCHQKGLFHPHAEQNLYTDALRPGHVVEGPGLRFQVVDLRLA
ncbi:hypothetical protein LTR36_007670 [Oleoguttula mirabilis]|uniref:MPN domain-containing protein n=1 Tax=Oleoguttula mirabilis TaxID=1507867 RepID=A0AAV9JVU9_9PEZI|nr:hypothetical protein LTR36_007670 [Oleoguttula mirabilis]